LDPSTPVALIGNFAQFSHQTNERIGILTSPLCNEAMSGKANAPQTRIPALRTSRRRLESTLTNEKAKSEEQEQALKRRRGQIEDLEVDESETDSSTHLETPGQNGRVRRQPIENDVNVWEDEHSGADFAVRLVSMSNPK
jgi:hypothetical protein